MDLGYKDIKRCSCGYNPFAGPRLTENGVEVLIRCRCGNQMFGYDLNNTVKTWNLFYGVS